MKGSSENTKHCAQISHFFSVSSSFFFLYLQWVSMRGKMVSLAVSLLTLHRPHSRPNLQPAQTQATSLDVTGAFLMCCRWEFGSDSSGVCDSPFQYTMLYGGSIKADTAPCSLKGRHIYYPTPTIYTPKGTQLKWQQEPFLLLFHLVKISRLEGVHFWSGTQRL